LQVGYYTERHEFFFLKERGDGSNRNCFYDLEPFQKVQLMKRSVTFTFPTDLVTEPVIYNLGIQFGIVTTILRANITEDIGWMMLEVEGEEEDIEEAITWVTCKGVKVEPIDDYGEG